jgi:hypothetical protein
LVPTSINSAYWRGSTAANADGSIVIVATPNVVGFLQFFTSGLLTAGYTTTNAIDAVSVYNNFGTGRVLSIGIRAVPMVAATAVPGVCYTGAMSGVSDSVLTLMNPTDFVDLPQARMNVGSIGASATGRPIDPSSFIMDGRIVGSAGYSTTTQFPFSTPFIAFTGLPASAQVAIEAVMHFEATPIIYHNLAPLGGASESFGGKLSDYWPNFEKLWEVVRSVIPPPGRPGETTADSDAIGILLNRFVGSRNSGMDFGYPTNLGLYGN